MRRFAFALFLVAACVPADGTFGLGSAQFTVNASRSAFIGFSTRETNFDTWRVEFDRIVLGFRTITIGKVGDDDRCSFRGRGESSDIVFDPRATLVQTFNGITPANCEDTGIFLSPPGDTTQVGPGATSADLVELAQGDPSHAIIDATARRDDERLRIHIVLDTARTSSRFGGCQARFAAKGVQVKANERTSSTVTFAPENMFQDGLGFSGSLRVDAFAEADKLGNQDGVFTMEEADGVSLARLRGLGDAYQLPNGTTAGSFGDYLRAVFRFTFFFDGTGTSPAANEHKTRRGRRSLASLSRVNRRSRRPRQSRRRRRRSAARNPTAVANAAPIGRASPPGTIVQLQPPPSIEMSSTKPLSPRPVSGTLESGMLASGRGPPSGWGSGPASGDGSF
jgi:hypothetical protein